MSAGTISAFALRSGLVSAGRRLAASKDVLCELDAVAGDGDLGVTLSRGFEHVERALGDREDGDAGALMKEVGLQLARNAPSTIGALLGSAFLRMSQQLDGVEQVAPGDVAAMLAAGASSVAERGGAEPGERTVLDAMAAAATRAQVAARDGAGSLAVLREGAEGAAAGADATAAMEPRHGRAGWIAERARGQRDAGAVAWAILLSGIVEGIAEAQAEPIAATQPDKEEPG